YADRPDAVGAHRTWRTGCYHFPGQGDPGSPGSTSPDLVRLLRNHGLVTALVMKPSGNSPNFFLADWDHLWPIPLVGDGTFLERTGETIRATLDSLEALDHWFLWVELNALVPPWEVPGEFLTRYF